jgi:glycosyltransferase involved in cell wall biosynthesis
MLHGIAELLRVHFGFPVTIVTTSDELAPEPEIASQLQFATMSIDNLPSVVGRDDLLVMSPAFSQHWLGQRSDCRKVMYVQHFNTYSVLDCFFDSYVCVSEFCSSVLKTTYGIQAPVIPAFVEVPERISRLPWRDRHPRRILVNSKGDARLNALTLETIVGKVHRVFPDAVFEDLVANAWIPHGDLLERLAGTRYLLTLSATEGFGLVPLEAMALGVAVTGFDGYGGREYMRLGKNCECMPFPEVGAVSDRLIGLLGDIDHAEQLSRNGIETAAQFRRAAFEERWIAFFQRFL